MIEDGILTHGSNEASIFTIQFTHPTFYNFLIAVLTTLLSYQAAAIIVDLLLGFKPADECQSTDVAVLHLSEQTSPLAVLSNVFERSLFSRLRYRGLVTDPRGTDAEQTADMFREEEEEDERGLPAPVLSKLVTLLLSAALINVFSIVLAVEVDRTVSFRDAKFGGAALGVVGETGQIARETISNDCYQYTSRFGTGEEGWPEFFTCGVNIVAGPIEDVATEVEVAVRVMGSGMVFVEMLLMNGGMVFSRSYGRVFGNMRHGGDVYRIGEGVGEKGGRFLLGVGLEFLNETCGKFEAVSKETLVTKVEGMMSISQMVSCTTLGVYDMRLFQSTVMRHIQLVDASSLQVAVFSNGNEEGLKFSRMDDEVMLTRRRPLVDFVIFVSVLGGIIVVRLLLKIFCQNDIHQAVEVLVRNGLNVDPMVSLLEDSSIVSYKLYFYIPRDYEEEYE